MSCFLYVFRHSTGSERSDVLGVAVGVAVVMAYCGLCHTDVPRTVLTQLAYTSCAALPFYGFTVQQPCQRSVLN